MDNQTNKFFEDILNDGGSPIYAGRAPRKQKELFLAAWLRSFGERITGLFKKKSKADKAETLPELSEVLKKPQDTEPEKKPDTTPQTPSSPASAPQTHETPGPEKNQEE